jgi:hypothetical protein
MTDPILPEDKAARRAEIDRLVEAVVALAAQPRAGVREDRQRYDDMHERLKAALYRAAGLGNE